MSGRLDGKFAIVTGAGRGFGSAIALALAQEGAHIAVHFHNSAAGAEEVALIARDIGVSPEELRFAASKGPHAADELPKLLRALGVDPQKLASDDPAIMRSLERICISCGHKNQCQHDLAAGTAASHYRDYCPNAMSLDELFHSK